MAKILIIDDDPDIVLTVRLCLEAGNHEVIDAPNGNAGLEKIKTEQPDLIILDVMMDTTTDGFQVAIKLRNPDPTSAYRAYSQIPILMLTSINDIMPMQFGPDEDYLPVDDFIEKPVDPKSLLKKIEERLAGQQS